MPLGCLRKGAGHQGDVAEGRAAEVGDHGAPGRGRGACRTSSEIRPGPSFADGLELLEVVLGVQAVFVDRRLAHDGVEEVAALGHAAAGRDGQVAFGIDEGVAVRVEGDVELPSDQDVEAVVDAPGLPVLVGEAEHGLARGNAPATSRPMAAGRSSSISPSIWYGSWTLTRMFGQGRSGRAAPPRN